MIILNPLEPWPGELVLDAAAPPRRDADHARRRLRRALPRRRAAGPRLPALRPPRLPARRAGSSAGRAKLEAMRPIAERHGLTPAPARLPVEPRAPGRALRRADADPGGRARAPGRSRPSARSSPRCPPATCSPPRRSAEIRAIGDNTGSMALKGAAPDHEGEPRPDRWPLTPELAELAARWGIEPARDLVSRRDGVAARQAAPRRPDAQGPELRPHGRADHRAHRRGRHGARAQPPVERDRRRRRARPRLDRQAATRSCTSAARSRPTA